MHTLEKDHSSLKKNIVLKTLNSETWTRRRYKKNI